METTPGAKVFLGLREDADVDAFERDARAALDGPARSTRRATSRRTTPSSTGST